MNFDLRSQRITNLQLVKVQEYLQGITLYREEWVSCKTFSVTIIMEDTGSSFMSMFNLQMQVLAQII